MRKISMKSKTFSSLLLVSVALIAGGCATSNKAPNSLAPENDYTQIHRMKGETEAIEIINAVTQIQNERYQQAWTDGPSDISIKYHQLTGTNAYDGWEPEVENPLYEIDTLNKYKDALATYYLFKDSEATVSFNDDLIIISMPNNWVWTEDNTSKISSKTRQLLKKMPQSIESDEIRIFVKSFSAITNFGNGATLLSQQRANVVSKILADGFGLVDSEVASIGLNEVSPFDATRTQGTTDIYIRHHLAVNSDRALKNAQR